MSDPWLDTVEPVVAVELVRLRLPLRRSFAAAHGTVHEKDVTLVRLVLAGGAEGWGECAALPHAGYDGNDQDGDWRLLHDVLGPAAVDGSPTKALGGSTARAAIEAALVDATLRAAGRSLADHLGAVRTRVPCGVAVGTAPTVDDLLAEVGEVVAAGYVRVKIKIQPGWDVEPLAAVRAAWPDLALAADANGSYGVEHLEHLAALDRFGLEYLEQPTRGTEDHANLRRRLRTPTALDEAITSASDVPRIVERRVADILCLKPARLGLAGVVASHQVAAGRVGLLVGGMLETGVGKAVNVAVAAMAGFTVPGDLPASDRWFDEDVTEPFVLGPDGTLPVPAGPGIGVTPSPARLVAAVDRVLLRSDHRRPRGSTD